MTGVEANKALVRRYIDEVQIAHRVEALDSIFAANFIDHANTFDGVFQGIDGLRQGYAELLSAFPDFSATLLDQVAEGDRVVTYKTVSGTHHGRFHGIEPTGRRFEIRVIDIFRIRRGRIAACWLLFDELGFYRQLGVIDATR